MKNIFTTQRTVSSEEIDQLNHVNNIVYLQWVQDVARLHWETLTELNPQENYIWVVIRHEIDYIHSAVLEDKITLKTWVGKTGGAKSIRHVEILKGNKLLAKAQTTWCLLDIKTMRPTRITDNVLKTLLP